MDISTSRVDHFIPTETAPGSRSGLDALQRSKALFSFQDSNHDCSVVSPQHRYCTHDWVVVKNMSELPF